MRVSSYKYTHTHVWCARVCIQAPTVNTYYALHFPRGVDIWRDSNSLSCWQFCTYRKSYKLNGMNVYYSVIPNHDTVVSSAYSCLANCGSFKAKNIYSTAGRALMDAITSPGGNAWWGTSMDDTIAARCPAKLGTVGGLSLPVQGIWSNSKRACV